MVRLLAENAPAKINLFLRVIGRRSDGYHELDSIFLPVSLCDRLMIEMRPGARRLTLRCDSGALPSDNRNLAARAANAFMDEFGVDAEITIDLHKEIPMGAGLGGGSSDAGAVLRMLAALCRIHDRSRLAQAAVKLGADVPFFLNPSPARVGGIGDRVAPLGPIPPFDLVIAVPPMEVPTPIVFRELRPEDWSGPASDNDLRAIIEGRIDSRLLINDLAKVAMTKWPIIARLRSMLEDAGARAAAMTGSGGAVFGIFSARDQALRAAAEVRRLSPDSSVFAASIIQ